METSMSQVVISSTKEIHLCDEDADGVVSVPFSHLQSYALDILAEFNEQPEIYLTQAYSGIIRIRNIYDANPQIQTLCQNNDGNGGFYDIAINSAKEIYIVRQGGLVQKVNMENQLCQYTNVGSTNHTSLALSFDHLDNLYEGGWTSQVFRAEANDLSNFQLWHDFGEGRAAGDFVQICEFMYVAWTMPNGQDYLYKVTLGPNNQYVSHENLGMIDPGTFGLAVEYGRLYGNTVDYLYEIDLETMQTTVIKYRPNPSNTNTNWWGAAGSHEAMNLQISYHNTQNEAINGTSPLSDPFVTDTQPVDWVYIRVHEENQNKTYVIPVKITLTAVPTALPAHLNQCADFTTGIAQFNLNEANPIINPDSNLTITYYDSIQNLENNQNPLPSLYSIQNSQTIYAKVSNGTSDCYGIAEVNLVVNHLNFDYNPVVAFCSGTSAVLSVPDEFAYYQWDGLHEDDLNQDLNSNEVIITHTGNYSLTVRTFEGCEYSLPFEAVNGGAPVITDVLNEGSSITVKVSPNGIYEYSLDGIFWQSSPSFQNIQVKDYDIHVRTPEGCYSEVYKFIYFFIPNFISPNGDGKNDTWVIRGLEQYPHAKVQIFDRYGKLFVERKAGADGLVWDGKYMGQPVPSGDYWYILTLSEDQILKGHITVRAKSVR